MKFSLGASELLLSQPKELGGLKLKRKKNEVTKKERKKISSNFTFKTDQE